MNRIKKRSIYKNIIGDKYFVLTTARHTETGEKMVVYQAMYGYGRVYTCPYDIFLSRHGFIATEKDYNDCNHIIKEA